MNFYHEFPFLVNIAFVDVIRIRSSLQPYIDLPPIHYFCLGVALISSYGCLYHSLIQKEILKMQIYQIDRLLSLILPLRLWLSIPNSIPAIPKHIHYIVGFMLSIMIIELIIPYF